MYKFSRKSDKLISLVFWVTDGRKVGRGIHMVKEKQSLYWHGQALGFQELESTRFHDNRHMKVVRLSALRTGRLYPPRKYTWYSFLLQAESVST
jgi:hypothetical protein